MHAQIPLFGYVLGCNKRQLFACDSYHIVFSVDLSIVAIRSKYLVEMCGNNACGIGGVSSIKRRMYVFEKLGVKIGFEWVCMAIADI